MLHRSIQICDKRMGDEKPRTTINAEIGSPRPANYRYGIEPHWRKVAICLRDRVPGRKNLLRRSEPPAAPSQGSEVRSRRDAPTTVSVVVDGSDDPGATRCAPG